MDKVIIIGTFIISTIALLISGLAYFRGRNIDLQNQIFLKKLDAFGDIIGEFFKLLKVLGDIRDEAERLISENKSFMNKIKLNQLGNKVDFEIDQIHKGIGLKSIFFSEKLIKEITDHLSTLYGEINTKDSENPIPEIDSFISFQTQELEKLITKMRKELGLDKLNQKLLDRIKKGNFRFDI